MLERMENEILGKEEASKSRLPNKVGLAQR